MAVGGGGFLYFQTKQIMNTPALPLLQFRFHRGQTPGPFRPAYDLLVAISLLLLAAARGTGAQAAPATEPGTDKLKAGFHSPPDSARAKTWWHWMSGCVSHEGITADLEAFKRAGLGGVFQFNVGQLPIDEPVKFGSDEWWSLMRFAASEVRPAGIGIWLS